MYRGWAKITLLFVPIFIGHHMIDRGHENIIEVLEVTAERVKVQSMSIMAHVNDTVNVIFLIDQHV